MKLYHGTNERALDRILTDGAIKPRAMPQVPQTQPENFSSDQHVYLTDTYGHFYALRNADEDTGRAVVIEIDIDDDDLALRADEDAIWQCHLTHGIPLPLDVASTASTKQALSKLNTYLDAYADLEQGVFGRQFTAEDSLTCLGTCSVRGFILTNRITRIAFIDQHKARPYSWDIDPCINAFAFNLTGHWYREALRWLFDGNAFTESVNLSPVIKRFQPSRYTRDGITVRHFDPREAAVCVAQS